MVGMLDLLQMPDGSYGLPASGIDPFTGMSSAEMAAQARDVAAERTRRGIHRAAPSAIDYGPWDSGASPIPYGMLSTPADAASALAPAAPPPMAPPTASPAPSAQPPWLGMLNAPLSNPASAMGSVAPAAPTYPRIPYEGAPASSSPAAAAAPLAAAASSSNVPETSALGRIGDMFSGINDWRKNNRSTLMALGAGMAGAQNFGQGLQRGMAAAIPAQQADIKLQQQNASLPIIRDRLMKQGLSATEATSLAQAAIGNPAIMQQMVPGLFGPKQKKFTQTGEDAFGNKQFGFVDEVAGKVYDLTGKEIAGGGGAGAGTDFLAKGVTDINHGLVGEDYLKQFSPEVQAAVNNYVAGESMPTGNPRKGFTQAVKMIAQKYGNDIGVPADDNTYAARHKAVTGLASTTPGSLGGQMTYARTSLNHLADVGEAAVDLDNSNGLGIAPLAHLINSARGLTTEQAAKVAGLADKAGHYGQEITKYYAGSPGGEGERTAFLDKLHGSKSNAELAAVLQSELELARGKMSKTQATIDESLGPNSKYQVLRPDEQKDIGRVEAAIARLRGQAPAGGASAPSASPTGPVQVPDKQTYDRLPKGAAYIAPDGSLRTKQ